MSCNLPANRLGAFLLAASASLTLVPGCAPPPAESGTAADAHAHGSLYWTEFSQDHAVFVDYAPPAAGSKARFLAHFTALDTGAPVAEGEAQIRLSAGGQLTETLTASVSEQPGLFILESFLPPGEYSAQISLRLADEQIDFPLVALLVHPNQAAADAVAHALADEENPDAIGFSLEQQWTVGLLHAEVQAKTLARRISVAGELEIPPAARAYVTAPYAGRALSAGLAGIEVLPRLGQRVEAEQVLLRIEVPLSIADQQALIASRLSRASLNTNLQLRAFDLQAQILSSAQEVQVAHYDIQFAERRLQRVRDLYAKQLALAVDLEDAEAGLAKAEQNKRNAEERIAALEKTKRELEKAGVRSGTDELDVDTGYALRAPIAGEIAAVEVALGQHVAQDQVVCEIINPDLIWLTAYVPEHDLAALLDMSSAHVRLSAYPDRLFDLEADLGGKLAYRARVLDPETRTATVRYELENPDGILRGGMFADVLLAAGAVEDAVAIPELAVVQQDGLSVAFVMLDGEHFEKRVLQTGIRDGGLIEVKSGLQAGERVVTRGAYLVRLAASAPDSFGHGHVH
jgi:RND family efflux transporter MFP subunit